ncbi:MULTISPECIES: flavin reductase family protein [Streptomycetaceae]|uniref:Reductase n=1 Tax=Streptantibioticus cattleyicolor (strain ATCC 35852 / DSM 46488 / JCM 4925 / NBRC 14057 / NRRL 8057) TaxID=1003195 RepID=F8K042_STREN|nr:MULTISPECIES: flavin reductase family protein [Streptomycetaceae]AEW94817.1 reductase [Streptantibioticus cattleyicolor NRRL 8057 = DSM 46488]MYS59439.1 flavin reductase [Streptomyces sp. SID5468]CCB75174.1 Reductase [Streptantibioticus cattleyicolor NRRL 8057 = DSM 46488]
MAPVEQTAVSVPHAGVVRPEPETSSEAERRASPEEFRAALARLAAGVSLVTAHDPEEGARGEDVGMTATAFISVSLEPPLVLVSLREDSRMDELLSRRDHWAVSVLSESQRHIAGRFAMRGRISDRLLFEDVAYRRGAATGAPLLGGALATLECRTTQRVPAGDHTLVIGLVLDARTPSASGRPLTYFRGRYHQLG